MQYINVAEPENLKSSLVLSVSVYCYRVYGTPFNEGHRLNSKAQKLCSPIQFYLRRGTIMCQSKKSFVVVRGRHGRTLTASMIHKVMSLN